MFWGLIVESNRRYTQTVQKSFHVSMATLEPDTGNPGEVVTARLNYDDKEYVMCILQHDKVHQSGLDLNFSAGEKVQFCITGKGKVHLTGYLLDEYSLDETELEDASATQAIKEKKRKKSAKEAVPHKKVKQEVESEEELEEDDENDDDDDENDDDDDEDDDELDEESVDDEEDIEDESASEEEYPSFVSEEKPSKSPKKKKKNAEKNKMPSKDNLQVNGTPQSGKKLKIKNKTPGSEKKEGKEVDKSPKSSSAEGVMKNMSMGVGIQDLKVGNGPIAKPGKMVSVYYTGTLKANNKQFDSTTQGPGFKFRLGKSEVIKGWDIGITGMKVGGKRRIVCPPHAAYGKKGQPPTIPANSVLVFDVELKSVS